MAGAGGGRGGGEVRWRSWLVPLFIVANVVVFVATMYVNNCPRNRGPYANRDGCLARFLGRLSFQPLRQNPLLGPSAVALRKMGALSWYDIVERHEGWRLISCIWLHAGLFHIIINMLCLVIIGIRLEQQFGFVRVGPLYLLSGFGGSIMSALFTRNSISVGASGALFGLLGAMLSELITNWTIYSNKVAALLSLLVIILINLAVGILPQVDNFAHIGGFLTGFLLGFVLLMRPRFGWNERQGLPIEARVKSKYLVYQYILMVISLALVIAGLALGLVFLYRKVNPRDHCNWCRYLSCVPTSRWDCPE